MKFEKQFEKFVVDCISNYLSSNKDKDVNVFRTFDNLIEVDSKGSEFETDIYMDTICNEIQSEVFEPKIDELEGIWKEYNKGLTPDETPCRMDGSIIVSRQNSNGIKAVKLSLDVVFVESTGCLQFDITYIASTESSIIDLPYRSDETSYSINIIKNTISIFSYLEENEDEENLDWGDDLND